jgi:hypothetical protein
MGLGVALGAATRAYQDTSRQLAERDWLTQQRERQEEQWQREDAIRNAHAQAIKPGQDVMAVTVNGGEYEMSPEQAAIYRQAGERGADVGAISRRRTQSEQDYMRTLSDSLGGLDPQAAMQLRMQAKQFEQNDMQLEAMREAMRKQEMQNKFLWLAQNKDALDDTTFLSGMAELVSAGGKDQRRAEVRAGEDGKPEVWIATPDGKQSKMQLPEDRSQLLAAAGKYLDMASYQSARKEEREDKRNSASDAREERKLGIMEAGTQSEVDYRRGKLRIDEMEARQRGAHYRAMAGAAGAKGAKWALVGYDDKNNTLIYQGTGPDGRLVIDAQPAVGQDGKPLDPTAIKGLFRGGVSQTPKAIDRTKVIEKYLETNPDATQRDLVNHIRMVEGAAAGIDPYALEPGGAFFAPREAAAAVPVARSVMLKPGSPEAIAEQRRLDDVRAQRAINRAAVDPVEAARLRRLEMAGQRGTEADLVNSLYR